MFIVSPYSHPPGTMLSAIQRAGLTSNLVLCLDAGDINSYDGTSQTWTDVSGNDYDFYRGSGSGSDGADPTFNGTAGRQSSDEYFSFDGGDYFTLAQSNPAWVNNLHKNNAKFTMTAWLYLPDTGVAQVIFDTYSLGSSPFMQFYVAGTDVLGFHVNNGSSTSLLAGLGIMAYSQWSFVAISMDEAANSLIGHINGTNNSTGGAYTSPSSSDATSTVRLAGNNSADAKHFANGSRLASFCAWDTNLSAAQLSSLFSLTRPNFGI